LGEILIELKKMKNMKIGAWIQMIDFYGKIKEQHANYNMENDLLNGKLGLLLGLLKIISF